MATHAILRLPEVQKRTGLCRSAIYQRMSARTFPANIKLGAGARAAGWIEEEVSDWIEKQIEASRQPRPAA